MQLRGQEVLKKRSTYWTRNSRFLTVSEAGETNTGNQGVSKSRCPGKHSRCAFRDLKLSQPKRKGELEVYQLSQRAEKQLQTSSVLNCIVIFCYPHCLPWSKDMFFICLFVLFCFFWREITSARTSVHFLSCFFYMQDWHIRKNKNIKDSKRRQNNKKY